jgi:hypothetical protein
MYSFEEEWTPAERRYHEVEKQRVEALREGLKNVRYTAFYAGHFKTIDVYEEEGYPWLIENFDTPCGIHARVEIPAIIKGHYPLVWSGEIGEEDTILKCVDRNMSGILDEVGIEKPRFVPIVWYFGMFYYQNPRWLIEEWFRKFRGIDYAREEDRLAFNIGDKDVEIVLPERMMGHFIGKGGATIKQWQAYWGKRIKLTPRAQAH